MVERALRAAGLRTGRYTSPHLVRPEERIAIDGVPVDGAAFDRAIEDVLAVEAACLADGRLAERATFFEAMTAVAFELLRRARVDVAVIEVGLGGRLDATNVCDPVATAIVSIDLDHQAWLGDTRAAIAAEKAAIARPGVPLVVGDLTDEALDAVVAARRGGRRAARLRRGRRGVRGERRRRRPPDDHARHGDADLRPGAARPRRRAPGRQRVRRGGAARGARRRRHPRRSPRRRDRPRRRALAGAARSRRAPRRAARAARRRAQRRGRAGAGRLARSHDAGPRRRSCSPPPATRTSPA